MWYIKSKKRLSNLRLVSYISMGFGFGFIIFGILIMNTPYGIQFGNAGMSLFMLGIALLALDFSRESDKRLTSLGKDSNDKMTTIANATFMEIVDVFEDKRIQLVQHPELLGIEVTIWKCKTYVDRAYDLHKSTNIDPDNRHRLFKWFYKLIYESGVDFKENKGRKIIWNVVKDGEVVEEEYILKLKKGDVKNIIRMINKLKDFDLNSDDTNTLELIEKDVRTLEKKMGRS